MEGETSNKGHSSHKDKNLLLTEFDIKNIPVPGLNPNAREFKPAIANNAVNTVVTNSPKTVAGDKINPIPSQLLNPSSSDNSKAFGGLNISSVGTTQSVNPGNINPNALKKAFGGFDDLAILGRSQTASQMTYNNSSAAISKTWHQRTGKKQTHDYAPLPGDNDHPNSQGNNPKQVHHRGFN